MLEMKNIQININMEVLENKELCNLLPWVSLLQSLLLVEQLLDLFWKVLTILQLSTSFKPITALFNFQNPEIHH